MIAGIITTPDRQQYLPDLVSLIAPVVDKVIIFNDTMKLGHTYNFRRSIAETFELAKEHEGVLLLDDDMTTVPDWRARFENLRLDAPADIYSLFTRQRHVINKAENGFVRGTYARNFYGCAAIFYNQQGLLDRLDEWFAERGRLIIPEARAKHFDVVLQEFFIDNAIEWVTPIPTLFDHVGEQSTMGHKIGRSISYVGTNNENL